MKAHENIVVFYRKGCSAKSKDVNKRTAYNPQKTPAKKRVRVEYQKSIELYHKFNAERNYVADSTYPRSVIMVQDDIYRHDSTKKETLRHPTRKPEKLLEYLVNTYSNENEIVFDPFTGSGTTAVACIRHNRRFIGIEKERKYFDVSIERIKAAYKELDSFFPEVLQHEQKKIYFNE
jgi:site-specific DNA-methyltransferase (adenine-specific)